jgi:hypothetical protein
MGSCICYPLANVENDPGVIYHTYVEDFVVFHGDFPTYQVLGCCTGVMYIKDNLVLLLQHEMWGHALLHVLLSTAF